VSAPLRPDWLDPLPDAAGQRAADRWAIDDVGIPSLDLMERAGHGLAELVRATAPDGLVVVVCGPGNNGGDGFVAARLLAEWGREVRVLLVGDAAKLTDDARANVARLSTLPEPFTFDALPGAAVIVDALLGTGISGAPRPPFDQAIEAIAAAGAPVVAADGPSGVDASTGEVAGAAIQAVATATFAAAKPGLWIEPGKTRAGEVTVVDIGIPPGGPDEATAGLIVDDALRRTLPTRARSSTKFVSGFVVVAGGAVGLTGAPVLSATAAMRAGAGYVTACVPAAAQPVVAAHTLEVMSRGLPDAEGGHTAEGVDDVVALTERGGALVLGPGLGRTDGAQAFARGLAARAEVPLLLDADGLFAFSGDLDVLRSRGAPTVLTPHEGELGRLLGRPSAEVQAHRLNAAREAATASGAIVVLKGDDTLVARPDGLVAVSPGATPALATAGTGDVLSGVIGALLTQDIDPFAAACAGVRLHAHAGILAAHDLGTEGVIASDVVARLPAARRQASA
jgi:NAD(P)H-hydrate epimerase